MRSIIRSNNKSINLKKLIYSFVQQKKLFDRSFSRDRKRFIKIDQPGLLQSGAVAIQTDSIPNSIN